MTTLEFIWHVANSPIGLMLVAGIISRIMVYEFKKHPAWQKLYDQNKGIFFDAVRFAESKVPDGAPNSGAERMRLALDYVQKLEHPIADANAAHLVAGIEAAHAARAADDATVDVTVAPKQ